MPVLLTGCSSVCSCDSDIQRAMLLQLLLLNTGKASQGKEHSSGSSSSCTDSSPGLAGAAAAAAAGLAAVCAAAADSPADTRGVASPVIAAAGGTICCRMLSSGSSRSPNCMDMPAAQVLINEVDGRHQVPSFQEQNSPEEAVHLSPCTNSDLKKPPQHHGIIIIMVLYHPSMCTIQRFKPCAAVRTAAAGMAKESLASQQHQMPRCPVAERRCCVGCIMNSTF